MPSMLSTALRRRPDARRAREEAVRDDRPEQPADRARRHRDGERDAGRREPVAVLLLEIQAEIGHEAELEAAHHEAEAAHAEREAARQLAVLEPDCERPCAPSPAFCASVRRLAQRRRARPASRPPPAPAARGASRRGRAIVGIVTPETKPPIVTPDLLDAHQQAAVARRRRSAHDHVRRRRDQAVGEARPPPTPSRNSGAPEAAAASPQPHATAATAAASIGGAPKRSVRRPDGTDVIAAPPKTIAVIAPICQRVEREVLADQRRQRREAERRVRARGEREAAQRDRPGAAGRARAGSAGGSHSSKV